jgi:hypothetical protein
MRKIQSEDDEGSKGVVDADRQLIGRSESWMENLAKIRLRDG